MNLTISQFFENTYIINSHLNSLFFLKFMKKSKYLHGAHKHAQGIRNTRKKGSKSRAIKIEPRNFSFRTIQLLGGPLSNIPIPQEFGFNRLKWSAPCPANPLQCQQNSNLQNKQVIWLQPSVFSILVLHIGQN